VTHLDMMPSLLELVGARIPSHVEGRSLSAQLMAAGAASRGAAVPAARPDFSVSESWALPKQLTPPAVSLRRGSRKLIQSRRPGAEARYQYYDLGEDPKEERDLRAERPKEAEELIQQLEDYQRQARARHQRLVGGGVTSPSRPGKTDEPGAEPEGRALVEPRLDPDREEKLRALGYIE
jgi:arylsulfatase A-like enzyme